MVFTTFLAAEEGQVAVRVSWNLVYFLIEKFSLGGTVGSALLRLAGILLCAAGAYLLGSINPAILISKAVYHKDIRACGSGNAGSTNMLRTFGKKAAAATFACDLGKALLAMVIGRLIYDWDGAAIAGFFVVFGHMFPIFERFRGGKGVACLAMVVLFQSPIAFLILLGIFLVIVLGTRFVSLGSVMCALLYPLILRAFPPAGGLASAPLAVPMAILSTVFVVYMHRENLKRLWNGKESKISLGSKKREGDGSGENRK